ncbi:hypothetical protein GN155_012840 [Alcanivorax sp. ZXX171]|nr:hypothetical protein [Alcanivorax sp. ZXX171]
MNPFPFPLSSLVAQAVAAGILVILSVIILSYLFLLFRRKKFVPVRGFLMDRSATARGHFFYEYEVKGERYQCSASSSLLTLSGIGVFCIERKERGRPQPTTVVYYDQKFPGIACVDREVSFTILSLLVVSWVFFIFIVVVF